MSNLESWLPPGGVNKFQGIKEKTDEAIANGQQIFKLSIGQPVGSALPVARAMASIATMMDLEDIHGYQDNGSAGVTAFFQAMRNAKIDVRVLQEFVNLEAQFTGEADLFRETIAKQRYVLQMLWDAQTDDSTKWVQPCPDFAQEFCQFHVDADLSKIDGLGYLPLVGLKPAMPLIPQACNSANDILLVATMTNPGYPVPKTYAKSLGYKVYELPLNPDNQFRFSVDDLHPSMDLVFTNYPHNPSGQTYLREDQHKVCAYCAEHGIRYINDAAYATNVYASDDSCLLSEVAIQYPDLEWAEMFSASKMGANFTGWRVGAICGSEAFINDIATTKGNTDSGAFAPAMIGALAATRYEKEAIRQYCLTFQERQDWLCKTLQSKGMKLAVKPQGTFFNIWLTPKRAFGVDIESTEHFNNLLIENGGLVGVHFDPYYRCAVVGDILVSNFAKAIKNAFDKAKVEY
jgi:aspartate/methionine/tyrosine aminotransferase